MSIVSQATIRLQAQAHDKQDAIRQAGELLVQGGCVEPPYVQGMLARELTMSTYLGNGVAIPHGQHEDLALVRRTGISVLQIPAGVEWEPGELAYLVLGIAASSDEHVGVLANLAEIIEDPEEAARFVSATDPALIIERLNRTPVEEA
jgi:mannitol/fructose-specific phosphotransferase system IIA component